MTAEGSLARSATYLASPFQEWLQACGLAAGEVSARVRLPDLVDEDMLELAVAAVGLAQVELVADAARGAVLRQNPAARTLEVGWHGHELELTMPWGTADAVTLRRVQEMVAQLHAGADVEHPDSSLGMRYARWQRSLAERAGTAAGTVAYRPEVTGLEQAPVAGSSGRWTVRDVPARIAQRVGNGDAPVDAVLLGAWQHLLSRMCDGPAAVWVGLDPRRGAVPSNTLGQLTSVRQWRPEQSSSVEQAVAQAVVWLELTAAEPLGWQERPQTLPPYAFLPVPGRQLCGDAVLEPPRVAPWAERMMLVTSVADDSSIELQLWHASRVADADADELLNAYVRLLTHLADAPRANAPTWNGTRTRPRHRPVAARRSLWSRVLDQAVRRPDAVAVADATRTMTYGELVHDASGVAELLREHGVGLDTRVVIHMAESVHQIAALLGVAAAGAAYVPIGVQLPPRRVSRLAELSGAALALTDDDAGAARTGLPCIVRSASAGRDRCDAPPVDLEGELDGSALAYVLHTSGTSGRPKGVMVTRHGLAAYVGAALELYGVGPDDTVINQTSPMFDLSVTSLLIPLAAGARLEIVDPRLGVEALAQAIQRVGDVALLKLTPAHLSLLVTLGLSDADARVRRVVVGGEQLRSDVALGWQARFPRCVVLNEYGPTETVVGVTVRRLQASDVRNAAVPIGTAVPGAWVAVCDDDGEPLEDGIPGEIVVGGATVARGYSDDPRLTAERFVPDLCGPPGARAYRTGDIAVATRSRGLLFRGRSDRQISVQGYRVEPAEVEGVLLGVDGVRDAAVVSTSVDGSGNVLVAYIVSEPGVKVDVRRKLADRLPDYMVPTLVEHVEALPMTASGKVNVDALPAPRRQPTSTLTAAGDVESAVAAIWAEVLATDLPKRDDKFFESGGTSFKLVTLNARLRAAFGRDVPLTAMFDAPTVRDLTELVRSSPPASNSEAPSASAPSPAQPPLASGGPGQRVSALRQLRDKRTFS